MSFLSIFFWALIIYIIITCIFNRCGLCYSDTSFVIGLMWVFFFSLLAAIILRRFSSKRVVPVSNTLYKFNSAITNNLKVTSEYPYYTSLETSTSCEEETTILQIKLNGNESPVSNEVLFTAVPQGYSETFNINVPINVKEEDLSLNSLLVWRSPNGTVLEVNRVTNFSGVLISFKTAQGIKFSGKIKYDVIANGVLKASRETKRWEGEKCFHSYSSQAKGGNGENYEGRSPFTQNKGWNGERWEDRFN